MFVSAVSCNVTQETPDDTKSTEKIDTTEPVTEGAPSDTGAQDTGADSETDAATEKSPETTTAEESTNEPFVPSYTGVFKAGYDRQDISPEGNIYLKDGTLFTKVIDPLYTTCIAVNDGENTLLLFTVDVTNIPASQALTMRSKISKATGVNIDYILVSGTHTHSAPTPGFPTSTKTENVKWDIQFYNASVKAAENAIADLSDTEVYIGNTLAKDMSFVRRWFYEDGTPGGIWRQPTDKKRVAYESDSDDLCQFIRFVREDKKDILLTSWGIHFTNATNQFPKSVSADINSFLRSVTERLDDDLLFAFYIAPSGNITLGPHIDGTGRYKSYSKMADALAKQIIGEQDNLTRVNPGKIKVEQLYYEPFVRKDDNDTVERATLANEEIKALNMYDGNAEVYAVCARYGFESAKEVTSVISRNKASRGETDEIIIAAASFGDIGFAGVPYEMFDTNGIELREASPFKMTIVITGCGGSAGYVPSALAVPNGGYEVYTTPWVFGTAEIIVDMLVDMLKAQKN